MKLVLFPQVDGARVEKIRQAAGEMKVVNCRDDAEALREISDADAFFGKISPPLLAAAGRLTWVQSPTASLEHYIFPELVEHPCTLTNMKGLFWDVIADHVFCYILAFARNLHVYLRQQTEARWSPVGGESSRSSFAVGPGETSDMDRAHLHVSDCTLGIVGCGSIGAEVGRRGAAFGMRVLAVDPVREEAPPGIDELWRIDRLDDLLDESDFVVIAAPHTPTTEGLFDRARIRKLGRRAFLINIGRGVIVRLEDLCDAIEAGEIAGAALDVFEVEPLPPEHRLWSYPNVILTPHVAACSVRVPERHLATLLDNVGRFSRGESLINVASKTEWF